MTERGFTLLELVIAIAILGIMMGLAWSTVSVGNETRKEATHIQERNHEVRIAFSRMARDLGSAYLSNNEVEVNNQRRTLFKGKTTGDVDELVFSSLAHLSLWGDANESDQTRIGYYAEDDPDERSKTNLVRREARRLSDQNPEEVPAEIDVLLRDVESVRFSYYDWQQRKWLDRWDARSADAQNGRLPTKIKIVIELENEAGETVRFSSQVRPMMEEQLQFVVN